MKDENCNEIRAVKKSKNPMNHIDWLVAQNEISMIKAVLIDNETGLLQNHPNIVTFHESWFEGRASFLAMEFFQHGTMREVTYCNPPLNDAQIVEIMTQISNVWFLFFCLMFVVRIFHVFFFETMVCFCVSLQNKI